MIRRLRGTIIEKGVSSVVLDVSGVGYLIAVPIPHALTYKEGVEANFYTHLAVRENALDLYGFPSQDELEMFNFLIDLPKIGPKTALQIMSQADAALLIKATQNNDHEYLHKMSGIGKKTAEKIILGLKDKLDGIESDGGTHHSDSDVVDALMTLGYSQKEARDTVLKIPPEMTETNVRIKEALRLLAKQ